MTDPPYSAARVEWQESDRAAVRRLDLTGRERKLRGAVLSMTRIAAAFSRAARRSMPFVVRYRAAVTPGPVEVVGTAAGTIHPAGVPSISHTLGSADGRTSASVALNADAIGFVLVGALGGKGAFWRSPLSPELSFAQRAVLDRVAGSLAADFAACVKAEIGVALLPLPPDVGPDTSGDSLRVACMIDGLPVPATVTITVSASAVEAAAREQLLPAPTQGDPRIAEALREIDLPVVAELGRVTLGLRRVLALEVGDIVRLQTATDDPVSIRVGGIEKFDAAPVVSRGQLAIEIKTRHAS